jgi:hypothetical protein
VSLSYHPGVEREAVGSMLPHLRETAKAIERCLPAHRLAAVSL